MSANAWVGSWRPHRPRGPIAALFGVRAGGRQEERSPGPAYLLPPGTTAKGKDGTPAFSIYGRPRDLPPIRTPGPGEGGGPGAPGGGRGRGPPHPCPWLSPPPPLPPGCYSPERAGRLAFPSAPACSLRSRTRQGTSHQTPGPAAYQLPPMLGPRVVSKSSAPNYSIPGRSNVGAFYEDLCKTPGPCSYRMVDADVYKRRAPQYSMLARNPLPGDTTTKPGPGAYSPEQV
ncbi:Outer dense fiber protein 3, partial [Spheniscus humboldti]